MLTKSFISNIHIPSVLKRTNILFNSDIHKDEIDIFYNKLCDNLFEINCKSVPLNNKSCTSYVIPGLNHYVKEFHTQAINAYII